MAYKQSFLKKLVESTNNEMAGLAHEEEKFATLGYIDTGSYALNALLSGSIYGGVPNNRILGFAGEKATGKTYFTLACIKHFMDANPDSVVAYFDSEFALETKMLEDRGIDTNRFAIIPVATINEFKVQASRILEEYKQENPDKRPKMVLVLDSLGMLSSDAEVKKTVEGNDTKDFTIFQQGKAAFRVLTLKLCLLQVPMFVTAHVYANIGGYGDPKKMGGGSGLEYAASTIVMLSKSKYKEDKESKIQDGAIITCKLPKSRFTIEGKSCEVLLHNKHGLDRYYGLLPIAEEAGIVEKVSTKYRFPDGTQAFEKTIVKEPEKYFTKDILDRIDEYTQKTFRYGGGITANEPV